MITKFSILILFIMYRFFIFSDGDAGHQPMMTVDGWNFSEVIADEHAFTLTDDSTLVEFDVVVLEVKDKLPVAYVSKFTTPMCDDTLCAYKNIQIYWNLLGNYIGYDTISGHPLTKIDHIKFEEEDYVKLHKLLMDDNSIINGVKGSPEQSGDSRPGQ